MKLIKQITTINSSRAHNKIIANRDPNLKTPGYFKLGHLVIHVEDTEGRLFQVRIPVEDIKRAAGTVPVRQLLASYTPEEAADQYKNFEQYLDVLGGEG